MASLAFQEELLYPHKKLKWSGLKGKEMSIEQPNTVDFISIDPSTNEVVLTISDHLTWEAGNDHRLLLQEKLNNYLAFIESGEIFQSYPESKGRTIVIDVVCEHPLARSPASSSIKRP